MHRMKANFMPMFRSRLSCILLAWIGLAGAAHALQSDQAQPVRVDSDSMQYDDVKQVSVFTGNVVVTKGSLVIRAERVEVTQAPDGHDEAVAYGSAGHLATYAQQLDAAPGESPAAMRGSALRLSYDSRSAIVTFNGQALLERLRDGKVGDRAQGEVITYNDLTDHFAVSGGQGGASASNPQGRVRVMLSPRGAAPGAPASGPMPALKPAPELGTAAP
jgi:lipopolysaccharide export system protein LptA